MRLLVRFLGFLFAAAATPTRNTPVPAANRKPRNRTSKRIVDYPFQPVRRDDRHSFSVCRETIRRSAGKHIISCPGGIFDRFPGRVGSFYRTAAVAKLGLAAAALMSFRFAGPQFAGPARATRLARKTSMACAIDPTVRERQLSDTRCSRSPLFET